MCPGVEGTCRGTLLLGVAVVVAVTILQVGGEVGLLAGNQASGALAGVDVVDDQLVQQVARRSAGRGQFADVRVADVEASQLPSVRGRHHQALLPPEDGVGREEVGQRCQESQVELRVGVAVGHRGDPPAFVDDVEERLDVGTHDVPARTFVDRLPALGQLGRLGGATRADVAVQTSHGLEVGHGGDHVLTGHALAPADLALEDEVLGLGQAVEQLHALVLVLEVAQQDVGADANPFGVEHLEALLLPPGGGVEVDRRSQARHGAVLPVEQVDGGGDPLQAVHDVDGAEQVEGAVVVVAAVLTTHAQIDVGHLADAERQLDVGHLGTRQSLALVGVHLEHPERVRVDDASQHHGFPAVGHLDDVQGTLDHLDALTRRFLGCHDSFLSDLVFPY